MSGENASAFWSELDRYHDLAKTFEQHIEVQYPEQVTSRRMCPCLDYCNSCSFPLDGKAEYYEYRGPKI